MTRALIVDDELDIAEVLTLVLEDRGFEVVSASDGAEAKALLAHELPDIIITDLMMPFLDCVELARWIRGEERLRGIPVVLMSAVRAPNKSDEALWQCFLQKPFTLVELVKCIDEVLQSSKPADPAA
ncbi:MAG: cheY [Labilithrix sp.]|nr:cheY [Labilithrix sp.]